MKDNINQILKIHIKQYPPAIDEFITQLQKSQKIQIHV